MSPSGKGLNDGAIITPMLHHLSFAVTDLARSAAFYDAALSALGYVRVWADSATVGYGLPGRWRQIRHQAQSRPDGGSRSGLSRRICFTIPRIRSTIKLGSREPARYKIGASP